ncbi:alkaline shock response membrane anchor protein AmaP [Kitasatospora viridis]|uniref:Putative alkaline shock family protein YloU n=1 Tax=Kitasatospora viridis TaxID=281105 RepID=A0A561UD37_9ACTN|nr:alkaline shock response membrane anchor protein AmaP [Kitasatospora viridis]TWF97266.1 putative alkaline shock family protein YloU [Kitasatospora viridis]
MPAGDDTLFGPGWGSDTGAATPAARRGRLRIADRVLERIARVAAARALGPEPVGEPPRVSVAVVGGTARIRIRLDLPFPSDLPRRAGEVREAMAEQVRALTGIAVGDVDVLVERLVPVKGEA